MAQALCQEQLRVIVQSSSPNLDASGVKPHMITDQDIVNAFRDFTFTDLDMTEEEKIYKNKQLPSGAPNEMDCPRYLTVFEKYKVIPEFCFACYKIQIIPRNVIELLKLMMVFEDPSFPVTNTRKCMVEERPFASGYYKGYIYCRGLEEAEQVQKVVKKIISDKISPRVAVNITHGCTEYAQAYPQYAKIKPASSAMKYRPEWKAAEEEFDKRFTITIHPDDPKDQTRFNNNTESLSLSRIQIHCLQYWLKYAATVGDKSYLEITGRPLLPLRSERIRNRPPFKNIIPVTKK